MAVADYFLKIDGIDGESQDSKHKNEIDVAGWSWSESQSGTGAFGGGSGAGKVNMNDFNFTMTVNKSSPKLMLACATGDHIKKAVLTCRKAGKEQQEYLKITFTEVLVSSYQVGGAAQSDQLPTDSVSLNFAKIEYEYHAQKPDGSLEGAIKNSYDLKANKGA
jgi:type VI secretion system secreted protein Hcp